MTYLMSAIMIRECSYINSHEYHPFPNTHFAWSVKISLVPVNKNYSIVLILLLNICSSTARVPELSYCKESTNELSRLTIASSIIPKYKINCPKKKKKCWWEARETQALVPELSYSKESTNELSRLTIASSIIPKYKINCPTKKKCWWEARVSYFSLIPKYKINCPKKKSVGAKQGKHTCRP